MGKKSKAMRRVALMCAIATMMGTLAGCGNKPETKTNAEPTSSAAAGETKTDSSGEKVTIKFAAWDTTTTEGWQKGIDAFEALNPNINVELVDIPSADYGDKLSIMLASGDDTDVVAVKDMPGYASFVSKNQIIALDDYLAKESIDMAPFAGTDEAIRLDGKLYGMPYRSDFWLLYYNKDIFDKAGIEYPSNDMTWEQYRELAKKLTSGTGNEKIYGTHIHTWPSAVVNWGVTDGAHTLADGNYDYLKPVFELALGLQNEDKSAMEYASLKTANIHYSAPFYKGQTAMMPMGSWFINTVITTKQKGETDVNWGIATVPHAEGQAAGETFGNNTPVAINAASKNKDAAWEFVKFITTEEGAKVLAGIGTLPAYKTQSVIDILAAVDGFPVEDKDALNVKSVAIEMPPHAKSGPIDKILKEEHELIMIGAESIDEGIANLNKRITEVLNEK